MWKCQFHGLIKMLKTESKIFFLDQQTQKLSKTVEHLKSVYPDVRVFNEDSKLLTSVAELQPDVVFLNLDLQPNDGIAVLKELRQLVLDEQPYVILYSDKQDDFLQELAYSSGADSFINFQYKALAMKLYLQNLLRRRKLQYKRIIEKGLYIDSERYLVFRNGKSIQLPRKEFQLLELLYTHAGKYFSKTEIADVLWKDLTIANKRIIDVHVYNIRQHFGKDIIHSQKGKGYSLLRSTAGI